MGIENLGGIVTEFNSGNELHKLGAFTKLAGCLKRSAQLRMRMDALVGEANRASGYSEAKTFNSRISNTDVSFMCRSTKGMVSLNGMIYYEHYGGYVS